MLIYITFIIYDYNYLRSHIKDKKDNRSKKIVTIVFILWLLGLKGGYKCIRYLNMIITVKSNNIVQNITYRQDKTKPRIL